MSNVVPMIEGKASLDLMIQFSNDKIQLLKNTVCKNATDDELQLFLHVCSRTGLDPFRNQIYAVKRGDKMTIQTGIDGFRLIAERSGKYAPGKEPSYTYDAQGKVQSATCYLKKQTTDGTWHEVSATAFWNEYVQSYGGKPSNFWSKMPHVMLAKCCEAICLRKAFPADFSGLYTTEEMAQADNIEVSQINNSQDIPVPPPIQENKQEDLSEEEINSYIDSNWNADKEKFREWLNEIIKTKKTTYRICIKHFIDKPEYTSKQFMCWLGTKVGI